MNKADNIRNEILKLTKDYYEEVFNSNIKFNDGDRVNYAGRVFDHKEMENLVSSSLDFWLTAGKYASEFEDKFCEFFNIKYCSLVNSGSSANLVAFMALTSYKLGERRIKKGDEVITVAAGFPTTCMPIIQFGAIPVFIDVSIPTYNIDINLLESALTEKTKAVVIAHTLGNPFNLQYVKDFCDKNNLWLIEDNCDALGSKYKYNNEWRYTGTIGDIGTSSFYPAHHITTGEGGAVYTNNVELIKIANSFRDWGRDCWCEAGRDNTCGNRFTQQFGELPVGYDHKYVYSHFGYNLKLTDMQAAIGVAQLDKLESFINKRIENWNKFRADLDDLSNIFILPEPTKNSKPSWFGFLITIRDNRNFSRAEIVEYLEKCNIQTRTLFAGNILKHPCFDEMRETKTGYRVVGELTNTDTIMNNTFWVGVYPGMTNEMIDYTVKQIKTFVKTKGAY